MAVQLYRSSSLLVRYYSRALNRTTTTTVGKDPRRKNVSAALQLYQQQYYFQQQTSSSSSAIITRKNQRALFLPPVIQQQSRTSSSSSAAKNNNSSNHEEQQQQPPLAVRSALVATTTAIGTPAFPVVGFVNFVLRWIPDRNRRYVVFGTASVGTCLSLVFAFAWDELLPLAYSYSQLFLPFALVNGSLAGGAFAVLDAALGTALVAGNPLVGGGIGAFVGCAGPLSGLYDVAFERFYGIDETLGLWSYAMANSFVMPYCVSTGAVVGFLLHPLLYYPVTGIGGVHWTRLSLPLLLGSGALVAHLYFAKEVHHPDTCVLLPEEHEAKGAVPRFCAKTLRVDDWDQRTKRCYDFGEGRTTRDRLRSKLDQGKVVFDCSKHASLYDIVTRTTGIEIDWNIDHRIRTMPKESDVVENHNGRTLLSGDGIVGFLMANKKNDDDDDTAVVVEESIARIAREFVSSEHRDNKNTLLSRFAQSITTLSSSATTTEEEEKEEEIEQQAKRMVERIEAASVGAALWMKEKMKKKKRNNNNNGHHRGEETTTTENEEEERLAMLEKQIRDLLVPVGGGGVLLSRIDEKDYPLLEGCSVEAQLLDTDIDYCSSTDEAELRRKWDCIVKERDLERSRHRKQTLIGTTVATLSVAAICWIASGLAN